MRLATPVGGGKRRVMAGGKSSGRGGRKILTVSNHTMTETGVGWVGLPANDIRQLGGQAGLAGG